MSVLTSRPVLRWLVPGGRRARRARRRRRDRCDHRRRRPVAAAAQRRPAPRRPADRPARRPVRHRRRSGPTSACRRCPAAPSRAAPTSTSLLSGTHTLRVWYAGPDQARVALLGTLGETDVITNGTDVWIWSSQDNTGHPPHRRGAGDHALPARLAATRRVPSPRLARLSPAAGRRRWRWPRSTRRTG